MDVSLERATADIRLRGGNSITLPQLRQIIKNNGFTSKEATVTAVGTTIERGGQPALNVTGTNTVMIMTADPKAPAAFKQAQERMRSKDGGPIQVTGVVETRGDQPDQILVSAIAPVK